MTKLEKKKTQSWHVTVDQRQHDELSPVLASHLEACGSSADAQLARRPVLVLDDKAGIE